MLIAKIQINYKNKITKVGDMFACSDDKVMTNLEKMGAFKTEIKVKKIIPKLKKVIHEESLDKDESVD